MIVLKTTKMLISHIVKDTDDFMTLEKNMC